MSRINLRKPKTSTKCSVRQSASRRTSMGSWALKLLKWKFTKSASSTACQVNASSAITSIQLRSSLIMPKPVRRKSTTLAGLTSSKCSWNVKSKILRSKKTPLTIEITQCTLLKYFSMVRDHGWSDNNIDLSVNSMNLWLINIQACNSHQAAFNLHRKISTTSRKHQAEYLFQVVEVDHLNLKTCLPIDSMCCNPTSKTWWWSLQLKSLTSLKHSLASKNTTLSSTTIAWTRCNKISKTILSLISSSTSISKTSQQQIKINLINHLLITKTKTKKSSWSSLQVLTLALHQLRINRLLRPTT